MREIKFRAWHEHNKDFEYVTIKSAWMNGVECVRSGAYSAEYTQKAMKECEITKDTFIPNADLEQFTGLRDKNVREIYEGDIVRFDVVASERGPEKFGQTGIVQDVPRYGWGIGGYSPAWIKNEEVIGNIHENPELLNEAV